MPHSTFPLFLALNLITLSKTFAAIPEPLALYGPDDRKELTQVQDPLSLDLSWSTAAIFEEPAIQSLPDGNIELKGAPLGTSEKLCSDEKFFEQLTPAICSGVLIDQDKVLTASHCLEPKDGKKQNQGTMEKECSILRIVLGWGIRDSKANPYLIQKNELYRCESIVERNFNGQTIDYVILKLDRPVAGRSRPVRISEKDPKIGQPLLLLGHPMGLPMKAVENGTVFTVQNQSIRARIDAFAGNSGSPVFDRRTGELLGILIEGEEDFYEDKTNSCKRSVRCDLESCQGETITRVDAIAWLWSGSRDRGNGSKK